MSPTVPPNTEVLVDFSAYKSEDPQRWDIVIFQPPPHHGAEPWMFRIVGLPGERMSFSPTKGVIVDGVPLKPPHGLDRIDYSKIGLEGSFVGKQFSVPQGQYFLLGDNPETSQDSRFIGAISRDQILAKVIEIKE